MPRVRVVELSNHPGALLREEQERARQESNRRFEERTELVRHANQLARQAFEAKLAEHEALVERLRVERDELRGSRRWWRRRRNAARLRSAERGTPRPPVPFAEPSPPSPSDHLPLTDEEAKLAAGIEGEERVATSLAEALRDEWTLLRGYCNRRGEIDQLLLGPAGLIAIEVKSNNATVYVKGKEWRFRKFDNYGNQVKEGRITDERGRSPSQQIGEAAAELERFLAKRGQQIAIEPVVILAHPRARIGGHEDITVTIACEPEYVVEMIEARDSELGPERLRAIERLIVKDHEFHAERQEARRRHPST